MVSYNINSCIRVSDRTANYRTILFDDGDTEVPIAAWIDADPNFVVHVLELHRIQPVRQDNLQMRHQVQASRNLGVHRLLEMNALLLFCWRQLVQRFGHFEAKAQFEVFLHLR